MSIRTYLIVAFTVLSFLLTLGMWFMADKAMGDLTRQLLGITDKAGEEIARANYRLSEQILSRYGERLVEAKAEDVAREVSHLLTRRDLKDYESLRRDPALRAIATQETHTLDGQVAGYMALLDCQGGAVLHPTPGVEGQNFSRWQTQHPEMWDYVHKACNQPKVQGYYTFFDDEGKKRDKYMVLVQVPKTPFIVAATVNIDEFFLPTHRNIKKSMDEVMEAAGVSISASSAALAGRAEFQALVAGLGFALLGALFGFAFAAMITRPLLGLQRGVQEVGEGNFEVAVPAQGAREVIALAQSFNELGRRLTEYIEKRDFIRDTFGRYVTKEVVKKLLEDSDALELGGENREITILMCDIRGFTAITADMEPEQVVTLLNRYLGEMIEILLDNQAIIDEIVGDGILAFLGAPGTMADHAVRAVRCALQMQLAMERINTLNAADGLPHLEMGAAVNTGAVVVGNIGSERRTKYSVVGAHVNFTSRIEGFAVGGQVLISASTYEQAKDLVEVGQRLSVEMKGVSGSVNLYEVVGFKGPQPLSLRDRREPPRALPERLPARLYRLTDKTVSGEAVSAWITHLCATGALVIGGEPLVAFEDVRLHLLDPLGQEIPGKIYGKITSLQISSDGQQTAHIRFTSVSPKIFQQIAALAATGPSHP